jgi:hypothetical protein
MNGSFNAVIFLLFVSALISCAQEINTSVIESQKIYAGKGPEDILLDTTSNPRLIISCGDFRNINKANRRGVIYSYDFQKKAASPFVIDNLPDSVEFFPHGISILPGSPAHLYVINHNRDNDKKKHTVLIFEINSNILHLNKIIKSEEFLTSPNDLSVLSDGSFYFTNTGPFTLGSFVRRLFTHPSNVTYYDKGTSVFHVVYNKIDVANGVQVIGNKVYLVNSFTNRLHVLNKASDGSLTLDKKIEVTKNMDNLSWDVQNNKLYIASHNSIFKLNKLKSDSTRHSPFRVHALNLSTNEISIIMNNDGSLISGVSTALVYNEYLYVSQIFGNYIERIKVKND